MPSPGALPLPSPGQDEYGGVVAGPTPAPGDGIAPRGKIAEAVVTVGANAIHIVRRCAQEWVTTCQHEPAIAVTDVLCATLDLAGLPVRVDVMQVVEGAPQPLVEALPERIRDLGIDCTMYPLLVKTTTGRKAVTAWQRFWACAIAAQSSQGWLDGGILDTLMMWLIVMSQAPIRSLRHVATVAALALAEALGHHIQAIMRTRDMLEVQVNNPGSRNKRQEAQLAKDYAAAKNQMELLYEARVKILEGTVPARSRDVCDNIRYHTLCEVERLMRQDPEMYLQNRWTARVFLTVHDPAVEVRLKALNVIHSWYSNTSYPDSVKDYLNDFAQRCLTHIVERCGDVEPRVAVAALRVLRIPMLAERLDDQEFEDVVSLCVGSREHMVREEAALFVNSHVFQDPGICIMPKPKKPRGQGADDGMGDGLGEADEGADAGGMEPAAREEVHELYNAETALSMLIEFLESYCSSRLRLTDRAVGAFWERAPSLASWNTMVNLCLIGEGSQGTGLEPISKMQRLALLYVMEASIRKANEELRGLSAKDKESSVKKLNDACARIVPEMPRLLEICRPEDRQCLLLSHMCKILLEYAVDNAQTQTLVNPSTLCGALVKVCNDQPPLDTMKYCIDALVALSRCFNEAKVAFLDLAKTWHHRSVSLLKQKRITARGDELRLSMGRYMVLSNRGLDMTFGSPEILRRVLHWLKVRTEWMRDTQAESVAARERAAGEAPDGDEQVFPEASPDDDDDAEPPTPKAGAKAKVKPKSKASLSKADGVPDARLTLILIEAATTTIMWYVRMTYWFVAEVGSGPDAMRKVEEQINEMLQGQGDFKEMRTNLPPMCTELREVLANLAAYDRCPHVQFHAFSAHMSINQFAVGASEKLPLEEPDVPGWGGMYEVTIPMPQMDALWNYLNSLYLRLTEVTEPGSGSQFDADGHFVQPGGIHPLPSSGRDGTTSGRFLMQTCMEPEGMAKDEETPLSPEQLLLTAVLCSRMVQESEVEEVFAGPPGMLLLTQVERSRPKPLREVGLSYLRRLRDLARGAEAYALLYFRVQEKGITAMFSCAGLEAARRLCITLVWQWSARMLPWLERPFFIILKDAMVSCITSDRAKLPLLDVYSIWVKGPDYLSSSHAQEIATAMQTQCEEINIDAETDPIINRALRRLRPDDLDAPADGAGANAAETPAASPAVSAISPSVAISPFSLPTAAGASAAPAASLEGAATSSAVAAPTTGVASPALGPIAGAGASPAGSTSAVVRPAATPGSMGPPSVPRRRLPVKTRVEEAQPSASVVADESEAPVVEARAKEKASPVRVRPGSDNGSPAKRARHR